MVGRTLKGYGRDWESYQLQYGEIWSSENARICNWDITKGVPEFMKVADMIYCDAPWTLGNVNMFNSKAGRGYMNDFSEFYVHLFSLIREICPRVCFLEIGKEELSTFKGQLEEIYRHVQVWQVTYYKKNKSYLIRGSDSPTDFDYKGLDDEFTPYIAIYNEKPNIVADACTGRGLTAISAFRNGCKFVGTELNARKLAVLCTRGRRYKEYFVKDS